MRRIVAPATLTLLAATVSTVAASCSGVKADTGQDAYMQVPGAQFVRGPMPAGSSKGPGVVSINLVNTDVWPGLENFPIGANLEPTAMAAAVGLQGDVGYWIRSAGVPGFTTPTLPSFSATAAFSLGIVPGTYTLVMRAVDNDGNYGVPATTTLSEENSPLNAPATGALVVTLTWDTESNLSLHVVDPNGDEIYWGNQSTQPPFSFDQVDGGSYGHIDYDSNANCVIDGLRREDAIWPDAPPPGEYTVRVDAPSLCGQVEANWKVVAVLDGKQVAQASGIALDPDTRGTHGLGSGVLAFTFNTP
jgi:hypothetical protein